MKERPILFSAPMVRALLDGSKTQTRRVIKKATGLSLSVGQDDEQPDIAVLSWLTGAGPGYDVEEHIERVRSRYGAPGDRLWVKESFWGCDLPGYGDQPCVVYDDEWTGREYSPAAERPWARKFGRIPSIHMARECSRIDLEVTDVRIERVHDISESDALAEGVRPLLVPPGREFCGPNRYTIKIENVSYNAPTAAEVFAMLWCEINGPESWDENPYVWVIQFQRIAA